MYIIDVNNHVLSKHYDLHNVSNLSVNASRCLKFFFNYPSAYDILRNNFDKSLKDLCLILFNNGIANNGKPFSIATISVIKEFLKDIECCKYNGEKLSVNTDEI